MTSTDPSQEDLSPVRYAFAITSALLLGGATATLALQPGAAQNSPGVAQNEPGAIQVATPRPGAPMSFADMVARLQPAVVNISTKQTIVQQQQINPFQGTPLGELFGQGQGQGPQRREGASLGSGFIISNDGYVVTNNHVVAPGARGASVDSITVTLPDRKEYTARLIGRDPDSDLALLKIDARGLPFVRFGDSKQARVGDWVVAIGNPFGLGGTVTAGIVSALNRTSGLGAYDQFIQTDAAINQGNSGGPMFNLQGEVIGINSQILGSGAGGNIGIGFAIPANQAKPIIDTLMKGERVSRGYIGVTLGGAINDDYSAALGLPKNQGEVIARVEPSGPAARGGLRAGDVVTRVNGQAVTPDQSLSRLIAAIPSGQTARLDVIRDNRPQTLSVTVATRPTQEQLAALVGQGADDFNADEGATVTPTPANGNGLGVTVLPLTPQIARSVGVDSTIQGVVIAAVDPSSDAGQKQLKRGDVITAVNFAPVRTAADVSARVAAARTQGRDRVILSVQRQRVNAPVPVKLAKG
ncbi:MAG: protease [Sphingomonas bacterium]|uniref:Do family serine endopeptidase n=1 Tax=Sphingomonas bacterium TaxID=1895847 RepID=UPI00261BCFDB|nr:Do family serine endopeptidase [Sphingomonas bacterium]MDB5694579.1 protease [Sphingomonas bacterium]